MRRRAAVMAASLALLGAPAAHAQTPEAVSIDPTTIPASTNDFSSLDGWSQEDHVAALAAFREGCRVSKDPGLARLCRAAQDLVTADETSARQFFENHFKLSALDGEGVLTGYYAPVFEARQTAQGAFTVPVRPRPAKSPAPVATSDPIGALALDPNLADDPIGATLAAVDVSPSTSTPPAGTLSRAQINALPADDALAWMRPEDLFFLQIQGSGVLVFEDGSRAKALYAGDNGQPFVGVARPMARQGLLKPDNVSGGSIQHWLSDHAGPEAEAVMNLNPRYVYFRLAAADGREPAGAAGAPLPAGRAIAVDPAYHAYGEMIWLDAAAPTLAGAQTRYRRLTIALDTGGAIKGKVRADLYVGSGSDAGAEAGRVRHTLRMVQLVPISEDAAVAGLRGPAGR
jgi:membrane-bound lytic murein transglycosylase A